MSVDITKNNVYLNSGQNFYFYQSIVSKQEVKFENLYLYYFFEDRILSNLILDESEILAYFLNFSIDDMQKLIHPISIQQLVFRFSLQHVQDFMFISLILLLQIIQGFLDFFKVFNYVFLGKENTTQRPLVYDFPCKLYHIIQRIRWIL